MIKKQAIKFLKKKLKAGYLTHSILLNLYADTDEIPEDFLCLCWDEFSPPKPYVIYTSAQVKELFENNLKLWERT